MRRHARLLIVDALLILALSWLLVGCTAPWAPLCDTWEWEATPGYDAALIAHYEALGAVCEPSEWGGVATIVCTTC